MQNEELLKQIISEVNTSSSEESLTNLWRKYLGKQGKITLMLKDITKVEVQKRKDYGKAINELKVNVDKLINEAKAKLRDEEANMYLSSKSTQISSIIPKLGHLHPITETINQLNNILAQIGYSVYDGPEIETFEYNFVRCNVPADHPALDLQDTIYIKEPNVLLRTQTSSIEARALEKLKPPFKIVMPGRVYRNEKVNKSNHYVFHQYQLVCVAKKVSMVELISTIDYVYKSFLGEEVEVRYRNKYYPEVEPGVGPDMRCFNCKGKGCAICKNRGWIEMGGAGLIHPNILKQAGLVPHQSEADTEWQGFAFGLGLDRWVMAKYNITDIRTLLGGNLAYRPGK